MEYYGGVMDGDFVRKQLTLSDVEDRLVVTTDMAAIMPHADPERNTLIKVLDKWDRPYDLYLSGRRGRYPKPVFQAREWRAFIQSQGGKEGDVILFRYEENKSKGTNYRMILEHSNLFPAHPGDL